MAKVVDFRRADDPRDVVHEVVQALAEGHLVGLPSETGYLIACSPLAPSAPARLQTVLAEIGKQQPAARVDCVLGLRSPVEALDYLQEPPDLARKLLRRFWPGPVTFAFAADWCGGLWKALPETTRALLQEGGHCALRVPNGDLFAAVLRLSPTPLLISGEPETMHEIWSSAAGLEAVAGKHLSLLVDAGPARYSLPTSLVRLTGDDWSLEREGVASRVTLQRLAGTLVLFVCTGNTCRSPMAEGLFRMLLAQRLGCTEEELTDRGYFVASAGVAAGQGSPPSREGVDILLKKGADIRSHESQPITPQLLSHADQIFTMTRGHRDVLVRECPEVASRVRLLSRDGSDVLDPIGSGLDEYRRCAEQIEQELRLILDELLPD